MEAGAENCYSHTSSFTGTPQRRDDTRSVLCPPVLSHPSMHALSTSLDGLIVLESDVFEDERGFLLEAWSQRAFQQATGVDAQFVQDNLSGSWKMCCVDSTISFHPVHRASW